MAALIERVKRGEAALSMSVINLGEVLYIIEREESVQAAQMALAVIDGLPVRQVDASPRADPGGGTLQSFVLNVVR